MVILDLLNSFVLGLLTPLTAVCVLPLYPGFLAYLTNSFSGENKTRIDRKKYAMFGLLITLGVILFMFILGLLFTTILQVSLSKVIGIISPIAFGILGVISLFLIFDIDIGRFIPKIKTKQAKNPVINAILYGFFFGAIVIPCNPGFIAAFLSRALLFGDFFNSILNFLFFGFGLGFPLLLFSLLSVKWSQKIIGFLGRQKRKINLIAGLIMFGISTYYLIWVFNVFNIKINLGL
jgi:cytochrome c-type biogenesis protein